MKLKKPSIFAILTAVILVVGQRSVCYTDYFGPELTDRVQLNVRFNNCSGQTGASEMEQFNDLGVQHTLRFAQSILKMGNLSLLG